jgi:hypothetical protein
MGSLIKILWEPAMRSIQDIHSFTTIARGNIMRDPIGQNYEKYFVKQKFETCQTKTENRMK